MLQKALQEKKRPHLANSIAKATGPGLTKPDLWMTKEEVTNGTYYDGINRVATAQSKHKNSKRTQSGKLKI